MSDKEVITTKNAPAAIGPYSLAVKTGNLLFVSGQMGIDPSSGKIVNDCVEDETRQALENLKAILQAAGSSLDKVVKTTVFITDINDFSKMNEVYSQYFTEGFPARSTVAVKLVKGAKVEVEAIALVK